MAATAGTPSTPLRPRRRYRIDAGAELPTVHGPVRIPATTMALLVALEPSRPTVHVVLAIEGAAKRVEIDAEAFQREATLLVGRPYCAAFGDPPRAGFGGLTVPGGSAAPAAGVSPVLEAEVEALQEAVKAHAEAIESQGARLDAHLESLDLHQHILTEMRERLGARLGQSEGGPSQAAPVVGRDEKIAALQRR